MSHIGQKRIGLPVALELYSKGTSIREISRVLASQDIKAIPRTVKHWLEDAGVYVGNSAYKRPIQHSKEKKARVPASARTCEGCGCQMTERHHRDLTVCEVCAPDARARARFKTYGIKDREYLDLLERQKHACPICERPLAVFHSSEVNIDHCHKTGRVRGVLCKRCNTGLALFEDEGTRSRVLSYLCPRA